jgi:hypothetical protein
MTPASPADNTMEHIVCSGLFGLLQVCREILFLNKEKNVEELKRKDGIALRNCVNMELISLFSLETALDQLEKHITWSSSFTKQELYCIAS